MNDARQDISVEAYHQTQMNERNTVYNTKIRGYKYIFGDFSVTNGQQYLERPGENFQPPYYREWRSYLEYCNMGTLNPLILRYKAWGYHLPEAFIWWMAHGLLRSCQSMEPGTGMEFRSDGAADAAIGFGRYMTNSFMLHNDMKEDNVFVTSQKPGARTNIVPYSGYPIVKMGDFGLSRTTFYADPSSRADTVPLGTLMYMPPVSLLNSCPNGLR